MGHDTRIEWQGHGPTANRRQALKLMAASIALAQGACTREPAERIHAYVDLPQARGGGVPLAYASAFVRDGYAQGVLVCTREGRPIKIEGNPLHPASLGGTSAQAQASVLQLWDPDRSTTVRQRLEGAPGPTTAPSTWPAFEQAWRARWPALSHSGGRGLRLLTGPVTSPTLRQQIAALLERLPNARWHVHGSAGDASARSGSMHAFGRAVQPVPHLDRARFVLALGADPFSEGPGAVRHAADWARTRAAGAPPMFSMALETAPGLFGARADERVALAPSQIEAVWCEAARLLMPELVGTTPAPEAAVQQLATRIATMLRAHGRDSLLLPGSAMSATSHALALAMQQRLGCFGHTLDTIAPPDDTGDAQTLHALAEAAAAGEVEALIVLGANPVYAAPGSLGFDKALTRVPLSIHHGLYADETARACHWHLPCGHDYEQWSDALAHDGSATILQPAIAPLYDSRSAHEVLALLLGEWTRGGHAIVQRHWQTLHRQRQGPVFDAFWRASLKCGVVEGSASPPLTLPAARPPPMPTPATYAPGPARIELVFTNDAAVHDGCYANNGWLQELPRPFSKLTWGNTLQLGPATARALGLQSGDLVHVGVGGNTVELPARIEARHAEGAASVALGYGRRAAGRVGDGVGVDVHGLFPAAAMPVLAVEITRTGRRENLARTQHEMDPHGREPARVIGAGAAIDPATPQPTLYPEVPRGAHAWGMVIDLDACIGCNACMTACQAENNIPVVGRDEVARGRAMHWIRVDHYAGPEPAASVFQPVPCMHCENAPCEVVCPVGATVHDSEGLNVQVYNRCVGTRFCSNNCPYKVRRFNFLQYADEKTETLQAQRNPDVTVRQRGVMEKCTYCVQRIARARQHAELASGDEPALADGDVVTACQSACPTRAIHFGDLADPASDVLRLKSSPRHYALLGELNTRPRTTYLARVAATRPEAT